MKLTALGDSIVKGYLVNKSFVEDLNIESENLGINGLTSKGLIEIVEGIDYSDIVLIHIGINDFLCRISLENLLKNLNRIIEILEDKCKKIILVSPLKIVEGDWGFGELIISTNNKLEKYNNIIKSLKSDKIYILSYYDLFINEENYESLFIDGIHPRQETHNKMSFYLKNLLGEINGLFE